MNKKNKICIIAGGGTGGHIYPGIAIAKALQSPELQQAHNLSNVRVDFVGTDAGLEKTIVPKEGYPLHLIEVGKLNHAGGILSKIKTILRLPLAFIQSAKILMKVNPDYVLGVGGYASGPFVLTSFFMGFKCGIWEPNAFPGMTNRWLSRFVKDAFVVFKDAAKFLHATNISVGGLPVRKVIESMGHQIADLNLQPEKKFHVLVFGGSQGAHAINDVVKNMVMTHPDQLQSISIIHQTGKKDYQQVSASYKNSPVEIKAEEYLYEMDKYYQWADLIVCRSGASTVAEIAACGKPAILIPLPTAADDHQTKNALSLVQQGAAILLKQNELMATSLIENIAKLKDNPDQQKTMRECLLKFHTPKAAETIAHAILSRS